MAKVTRWFNNLFETNLSETKVTLLLIIWACIAVALVAALIATPTPFGD